MDCTLISKEVATTLFSTISSLIPIVIAACLTYRYAIKKLRKESFENIERAKYEAILKAHQSIYKLLRFITDTENDDCILVWEQPKGGGEKTYYFRQANIRKFIKELTEEIYNKGNGIFLSKKVMPLIFEYRSLVYGLLLTAKDKTDETIEIDNEKLTKRMIEIHQILSIQIRKDINLKQRDLQFDS
ncbi:type VI-B CRISPR accessory protein Csx28 [Prevotella pallens]